MPRGETILNSDWEQMRDGQQQQNTGLSLLQHPPSSLTMYNDAITERALTALDEDSSDESDVESRVTAADSNGNQLQNLSSGVQLESSNVEAILHPSCKVKDANEGTVVAAEPLKHSHLKREQVQKKREIMSKSETKAAIGLHHESDEIVDLTLSDDEDEKGNPTAPIDNTQRYTPESAANPNCQKKRGSGLRILDEFRVVKQVPAQRLPFLSGKLTVSNSGQTHQLLLRGAWGYKKRPDFTPQRFELVSEVMLNDLGSKGLPSTCTFHGSFVYHHTAIEEKDVIISFYDDVNESALINVKGSGTNQFGRFELNGTAERLDDSDGVVYSLMLTKIYDKPYLPADEKLRGRKRKPSVVDSTNESKRQFKSSNSTVSDASFTLHSHAGSKPSVSPPLLTDENVEDSNGHTETVNSVTQKRATLFDQVATARTAQKRSTQLSVPQSPVSKRLLGFAAQQHSMAAANVNREISANKTRRQLNNTWHEFGSLSNSPPILPDKTHRKHYMAWTIKDVAKPSFAKNTLDFCESVGIHFVNDLLKADPKQLYADLMLFSGFKVACATAAWANRKSFHDMYKLSLAQKSIKQWRLVASKWWKKTLSSDWACKEGRLSSFLSSHEASFLETNFGIISADQLLLSNPDEILDILRRVNGNIVHCEGMFYSWFLRAQEKSNRVVASWHNPQLATMKANLSRRVHITLVDKEINANDEDTQSSSQSESIIDLTDNSPMKMQLTTTPISRIRGLGSTNSIQTPMQCVDVLFLSGQFISSDEQLLQIDVDTIAPIYRNFLETNDCRISLLEARQIVGKWRKDALNAGKDVGLGETKSFSTRIDKSENNAAVMSTVSSLSRITMSNGLPNQTIFTFDDSYDVLYAFRVHIEESKVAPNSGNGAFLTFEGAKALKQTSYWKKKSLSEIPTLPKTKRVLTAAFAKGGSANVTLKGQNLHGDEGFYGPKDGIGTFAEYTLDDFVDVNNATFSSKHNIGCAMIELDRYAPILPEDRKPALIFGFKDFIFRHEPGSWRFDIEEELNGQKQVADFTDDGTGSPHYAAKSHTAMYVNEVGHNENLVENVRPLSTPRSVSYYVFIDKPMTKGETVELLVDYGAGYEDMRIRRGYGKSNALGVKSDADAKSRTRRNIIDRSLIEESIMTCSEEEICEALTFFETRVWNRLNRLVAPQPEELHTLRTQNIARMRLTWLASKFRRRLLQLSDDCALTHANDDESWYIGMFVFVNGWMPQDDPRPPYTGVATVNSLSQDKFGRTTFNVSIPGSQKTINSVPEGAVTLPVEEDLSSISKTAVRTWKKQNRDKHRIQLRAQMLEKLDTLFQWDKSFIEQYPPALREHFIEDYRWEMSEELLYVLKENNRLLTPFDNTQCCSLSQDLLQNMLHAVADFLLDSRKDKCKSQLLNRMLSLATDSVASLKELTTSKRSAAIGDLSFASSTDNATFLIAQSIAWHKVSVEEFTRSPQKLDFEWYLCNQIVMVAHTLLSSISWDEGGTLNSPYSLRLLCSRLGLEFTSPYLTFAHTTESFTPLISL